MKPRTRFSLIRSNLETSPLIENLIKKQFQIKLDDERNATVNYRKLNDNTYDLVHSSIPEEYQGMGLGHTLAKRVFDHLASENKKFKITCEFLQKCFEKNREKYKAFVTN
ncbi:hypothetical protein NQ318_004279 [Aromia moschata]|uniref:Protein NATD1 n=1 Tax=Aromia moschata TaxID=1265417 RepID=A0AAV8XSE6_9CUCU|nr:hypothetical protein NQ318_004279 [Aromia moschata]